MAAGCPKPWLRWEDPTDGALTIQAGAMSGDQAFATLKTHFGLIAHGN
jgi:hypothetical protein